MSDPIGASLTDGSGTLPPMAPAEIKHAPSAWHVIRSIASRELVLASRTRLMRFLFLGSILPPLVFVVVLVVQLMITQNVQIPFRLNPLLGFLEFMGVPVLFLSLGLGTPSVSRDRAEDVLFLYATRPVLPWHYALGKMFAVAVPAFGLMLFPGILTAILRAGVVQDIGVGDAFGMIARVAVVAAGMGWGYAGVTVGPSALVKKARWALVISLVFFMINESMLSPFFRDPWPLSPNEAFRELLNALFGEKDAIRGWISLFVLNLYGWAGFFAVRARVRTEMTP